MFETYVDDVSFAWLFTFWFDSLVIHVDELYVAEMCIVDVVYISSINLVYNVRNTLPMVTLILFSQWFCGMNKGRSYLKFKHVAALKNNSDNGCNCSIMEISIHI